MILKISLYLSTTNIKPKASSFCIRCLGSQHLIFELIPHDFQPSIFFFFEWQDSK